MKKRFEQEPILEPIIFQEPVKTLIELLKVHNREVPFANLLAFYFRPKEEHKLGSLFLEALLDTQFSEIGKSNQNQETKQDLVMPKYDKDSVKVRVEVPIKNNKEKNVELPQKDGRVDILITSDTFVICIEFKINHHLDNPLSEYQKFVEKNILTKRTNTILC